MKATLARIIRWRFWSFIVLPNLAYLALTPFIDADWLTRVASPVLLLLALVVITYYAPAVYRFLFKDDPISRAGFLALGILLVWTAHFEARAYGLFWHALGLTANAAYASHWTTHFLLLYGCAAVFHILAPADGPLIPGIRWPYLVGGVVGLLLVSAGITWMAG